MYEDMTFENIMVSMMEDMPDGLDTRTDCCRVLCGLWE